MDQNLSVNVPRNLRVGTTVAYTIADTTIRMRLPLFLWLAAAGLGGVVALLWSSSNLLTPLLSLAIAGTVVLEARFWGYGTNAWSRIVFRYLQQPKRLQLQPVEVLLPAEAAVSVVSRRPRWMDDAATHTTGGGYAESA